MAPGSPKGSRRAASPSPAARSSPKQEAASPKQEASPKPASLDVSRFVDVFLSCAFVCVGIYTVSYLDKYPMPFLSKRGYYDAGLEDIKFYCPPHGAIAVIFATAKNFENLKSMAFGIILGTAASIAVVEFGAPYFGDDLMMTRSVACGAAMAVQMLTGFVFAPAGALAVLFVDNKAMQTGVGRAFCLMPGLSGFLVLYALAYVKVGISELDFFSKKNKVKQS